jgi:hypothetical protein
LKIKFAAVALTTALAAGIVLPLLWEDDDESHGRRLSVAEVEHRLSGEPQPIPFAPRASRLGRSMASCVAHGSPFYSCTVTLMRRDASEPLVFYDFEVPAVETSPEQRAADIREGLALGHRLYCHGTPPPFAARCDAVRCLYRIGHSGAWIDYRNPPSTGSC